MKSRRSWPALWGLTFALASASAAAQAVRPLIPPLPTGATNLPALDARALEALRPPGERAEAKLPPAPSPAPAAAAPGPERRRVELSPKVCRVDYYPKTTQFNLPARAAEVKLTFTGDKGCLTAVSADRLWVDTSMRSFKQEVVISVVANTEERARTAKVFVVAGEAQLEFFVSQEGAPPAPIEVAPLEEPPVLEKKEPKLLAAPGPLETSPATAAAELSKVSGPRHKKQEPLTHATELNNAGTLSVPPGPVASPEMASPALGRAPADKEPAPRGSTPGAAAPATEKPPSPIEVPSEEAPPAESPAPGAERREPGRPAPGDGYEELDLSKEEPTG